MADTYEYFVRLQPPEHPVERPLGLWRRSGGTWEYWSIIDWQWHRLRAEVMPVAPSEGGLVPITAERAAQLVQDRQSWVRYWAYYIDEPGPGVEPVTVLRRRASLEHLLDESYNAQRGWGRTAVIVESEYPGSSTVHYLVDIDRGAAESIIRRISGIERATEL